MTNKIILLFSTILTFLFSSCIFLEPSVKGNGDVIEQVRTVKNFHGIKAARGMNVYISQGESEKVMIKADENLLNIITTEVKDGILHISVKERIRWAKSKKAYITVRNLDKVSSSSGSNVYSETLLEAEYLDLSSSSGANMKLELKSRSIEASASSGANLNMNGSVDEVDLDASSGANIKARDLKSQKCKAEASSGANIWISVSDELNGKASSGGNVNYFGDPKETNINTSSGGNVRKKS